VQSLFFIFEEDKELIVKSKVTGKTYDSDNVWYITDVTQVAFYFSQGIGQDELLDILYDNSKIQCNRLCFVYPKTPKMKVIFDIWNAKRNSRKADENKK
jgi:hypothetical protein